MNTKKVNNNIYNKEKENKIIESIELEKYFGKYIKYFTILFLTFLLIYILYPFFNIPVGKIGIVENFFTKKVDVFYTGFHIINPFSTKTIYNGGYEVLSFNGLTQEKEKNAFYDNIKSPTDYSKLPLLQAITKDGHNLSINIDIIFRIKSDPEIIKNIYAKSKDKYIEILLLPLISKATDDVIGKKDFYSIVSGKESISNEIKESINNLFNQFGFELITFSFKNIVYSKELEKRVEEIFDSQKAKKLAEIQQEKINILLQTQERENESKLSLMKKLKSNGLTIDEYVKIKMTETFNEKWNGNFVPDGLKNILFDIKK